MRRLDMAMQCYRMKGTPKFYIDTLDISEDDKHDLYNEAIGRISENNPYEKEEPKKAPKKRTAKKEEPKEEPKEDK